MPWSVEYNIELKIIEAVYIGRVTFEDFRQASIQASKLAETHNVDLYLIDDSQWEGGTSTIDLYDLPKLFEQLNFKRTSKGALILPPSDSKEAMDAQFFETVCVNRGWKIKVFPNRQTAIDWLTSEA